MDESLILAAKLFQNSLDLTFSMSNSSLEYFQKRSEELEKACLIYEEYIRYVNLCVQLFTVPRNFSFWTEHIR